MRVFKRLFIAALVGLTGLSTVQAEMDITEISAVSAVEISAAVDIPAAVSKSSVFIVQMRDDPAVAYTGDIARYNATKPGKGKKINPNSAHVKKYVAYLDSTHDKALRAVGVKEKIYSYHYALNGFAAVLTSTQVEALRSRSDVVQIWQDERRQPTTDSTPDYLGLTGPGGVWDLEGKGEDIIVGIIDTGIWPEHPSFSDQTDFSHQTGSRGTSRGRQNRNLAYGPPPSSWHGSCQSGERFSQDNCNNKLIGARYYNAGFGHGSSGILTSEFLSARDSDGHGSHTASTAAGNEGPINTINHNEVSGIAPRARIAAYKVCWVDTITTDGSGGGCFNSDSAAAIDQAVADGVDVINFSIGGGSTSFSHPDDIAFLFAAAAGVFVATSNGNAGPGAQTTGTPAGVPWVTAVGAATDDAVFALSLEVTGDLTDAYFALEGDGDVTFADTGDISGQLILVDDGVDEVPDGEGGTNPSSVNDGCEPIINDITGEIALVIRGTCSFTAKYNNAADAGATAIIVYNDGTSADRMAPITMFAPGTSIPGAMISFPDGNQIANAANVNGLIGPSTEVSQDNRIASFSSRGPNGGAPDVIKPDVAAPGVSIIAAETLEPNDDAGGGVPYQRISGTSMSSPHVAGIFALLKEAHPDWSAADAKSALMTSARQDLKKTIGDDAADPFDIGAGAIVPAGAFAPGLVYDAGFFDYLAFSCDNNFQLPSDDDCELLKSFGFPTDGSDLNLASIGVAELVGSQSVTRTVTSVTPGTTTFDAVVVPPPGIDVAVNPMQLVLDEGESATFTVEFAPNGAASYGEWTFGSLTWTNDAGASDARSPIAIRPVTASNAFLFTKTVDASSASAGDTLTYELSVINGPLTGPITVTDMVPDGATFVADSDTEVVVDGSTSSEWTYDGGSNSLSWTGELAPGEIEVVDIGEFTGFVPLNQFDEPFGFPSNCDDGAWALDVPPFTYNGISYSSVIWSVNGTLEAGTASGVASSFDNQKLPDSTLPNNILAPFWRDLNGCTGGHMFVVILNSGPFQWTVYEWDNVPFFGSTDAVSMQVWVLNDSSPQGILPQAHFTYGRLDNTDAGATVGAENAAGSIGDSYFYNGEGTPPAVGSDLGILSLPGGTATLGFQVTTDCSESSIVNKGELTNGENSESAIAVTACP